MKLLIQKVVSASVSEKKQVLGQIRTGLLILVGFNHIDTQQIVDKLVVKLLKLRIFPDKNDKMNLSVQDIKGELLIVSQFTLYADCRKGNRPSFIDAAMPEKAEQLYDYLVSKCKVSGLKVETGKFGAHMQINLINDGPVTIILDN